MKKKHIGWVPLDFGSEPLHPELGRGWRKRSAPPRIYQTEKMAQKQSPIAEAVKVFIEVSK